MLTSNVTVAATVTLLAAAIVRYNLFSFGYFVFYLAFFFVQPVKRVAIKSVVGRQRREGKWKVRRGYFLLLLVWSLIACLGHACYQILLALGQVSGKGSLSTIFSYKKFSGAGDAALSIAPDAAMLIVSLVALLVVSRVAPKERPQPPPPRVFLLKFVTFVSVFIVAVANPSIFGLVYFVFVTGYLILWAFRPHSFGLGLPNVGFGTIVPICLHLIVIYSYQFKFFQDGVSANTAAMIGLFKGHDLELHRIPMFVSFLAELVLIFVLSEFKPQIEAYKDEQQRKKLMRRYSTQHASRGLAIRKAFEGKDDADEKDAETKSSEPDELDDDPYASRPEVAERVRLFLSRSIRDHGRKLCHVVLFVAAFLDPSYLSAGLLMLFCLSVSASDYRFSAMVPGVLVYAAAAVTAQYLYAIPHLFQDSTFMDMIGLSKHSPYPVYWLTIAYTPVFFFAGYARLVRISNAHITKEALLNAAATGDLKLLAKAIEKRSAHLKATNDAGETLLHVAAASDHARCVAALMEKAKLNPDIRDKSGGTSLHTAYRNGNGAVVETILLLKKRNRGDARDELISEDNPRRYQDWPVDNEGKMFHEVERGTAVLVWSSVRTAYQLFESAALTQANKISLAALFVVGMQTADLIHLGYIVMFLLFVISPSLARRFWALLVSYCSLVLVMLFSWNIFLSEGNGDPRQIDWANKMGLFRVTNVWRELFWYYLIAVFTAIQLHVYSRLDEDPNNIHSMIKSGMFHKNELWHNVVGTAISIYSRLALIISYTTLVVVAYIGSVTVIKLGYLLMFVICLALHQVTGTSDRLVRWFWVLPLLYSAFAFFVLYAYQFSDLRTFLNKHYPESWKSSINMADWGFTVHAGGQSLILHLLAPTAVFVVCVIQWRLFRSKRRLGNDVYMAGPTFEDDASVPLIEHDSEESKLPAPSSPGDNPHKQDSGVWRLAKRAYAFMREVTLEGVYIVQTTLYMHMAKILVLFLWINVSTIEQSSLTNLVFLVLALVSLPAKNGQYVWLPVFAYGAALLLARYAFQFPENLKRASTRTQDWYGFRNYHDKLFTNLWGLTVVLVLATTQRVFLLMGRPRYEPPAKPSDRYELAPGQHPNKVLSLRKYNLSALQITQVFLINIYRRLKWLALHFYEYFGLQVSLGFVLLTAFARSNAMSLFLVCFVCGVYFFQGRRALSGVWPLVLTVLLLGLVWQYYVSMGSPPGHPYSWETTNIRYQRWYMLGGFSSSELNWDFFALLLSTWQYKYFKEEKKKNLRDDYQQTLGLQFSQKDEEEEIIYGDPNAWYNTCFEDMKFYLYVSSDKIILLFVFFAGTFNADILSFGYVVLAMLLMMSKDLIEGNPETDGAVGPSFIKHKEQWSRMHKYNYLVLFALVIYQIPFIPNEYYDSPVVRWERLLGLNQYTASDSNDISKRAMAASGALHSVIIFILIDLQLMVFSSEGFKDVLQYYEDNRNYAHLRGRESAQHRKSLRVTALAKLMGDRRGFRNRLNQTIKKMEELGDADTFIDQEVWPQEWNPEDGPDTGHEYPPERKEEISDEFAQKFETYASKLEEQGLTQDETDTVVKGVDDYEKDDEKMRKDNDVLADVEKAVSEVGDYEEESSLLSRKWHQFVSILRTVLISRIDYTLWMIPKFDPSTGTHQDVQQPMDQLSTISLIRRWVTSNSQFVCFVFYLLNLYENASLWSMLVPVLIFIYAIFEQARAPQGFWIFCLYYSVLSVSVKFLYQLDAFCNVEGSHAYSFQPSPYCSSYSTTGYTSNHEISPDWLLGIHKEPASNFFVYVLWDLLCIGAVVWHRWLMISKGVWYWGEEHLGDDVLRQQQKFRKLSPPTSDAIAGGDASKKKSGSETSRSHKSEIGEQMAERFNSANEGLEKVLQKVWMYVPQLIRDYYFTIIPRDKAYIHVVKPGRDYYLWMFVVELFASVYILVYYNSMATTSTSTVTSSIQSNLFSGAMVITLLIQVTFIIFDRLIYLHRSLRWKIVLQYISLVFWFYIMFYTWPKKSQILLHENGHTQFFFLLKCLYFIASGLQIRWGYPSVERTGFQYIMRKPSIFRGYFFRVYRAIPFVFELRSLLDWMSHESALDLWEHLKLEDIYANMFLVQCDIIYRKEHKRGEPQPGYMRFFNGVLVFIVLVFILFAPLFLFSSANPVTSANNVISTKSELSVIGPTGDYSLMTISSIRSLSVVSTRVYSTMKQDRVIADDSQNHIQSVSMVPFADSFWDITTPSENALMESLLNTNVIMSVNLHYSFTRNGPPDSKTIFHHNQIDISQEQQSQLANMITGNTSSNILFLEGLVPKYLRLPSTGTPITLTSQRTNAYLQLSGPKATPQDKVFWQLKSDPNNNKVGITFITISNPIFENLLGLSTFTFSVIGLYSIVVLTVGRFVRLSFANLMQLIPYEDLHDADSLVHFCEGVYIARYVGSFMKEERLYRRLIYLFRTPPLLRQITQRKDHED